MGASKGEGSNTAAVHGATDITKVTRHPMGREATMRDEDRDCGEHGETMRPLTDRQPAQPTWPVLSSADLARAQATHDAALLAEARALVPVGMRVRSKDELFRHLTTAAREATGRALLMSERQRLWTGCALLWASGDVHETPTPCPSTSPARTVRAGAVTA
jgi:hypothetical protein